jgi:hypothetical protein
VSPQSGDRKPMAEYMNELTDAMVGIGEAKIAAMRAAAPAAPAKRAGAGPSEYPSPYKSVRD